MQHLRRPPHVSQRLLEPPHRVACAHFEVFIAHPPEGGKILVAFLTIGGP
jgi:hypothetical protein